MKPIKICIVINELLRGGAQRIVSDLSRSVDTSRFSITVVYLKSLKNFAPDAATVEKELHDAHVRLVSMEGEKRFSISDFVKLVQFLRAEKPDIVHTFLPYAGTLGRIAARIAGVPHIISTQCNVRVAYNFVGYWIDRMTLPLAGAWTGASEGIELEYGRSVAPFTTETWMEGRRHFTITGGVDLPVFDARIASIDRNAKRVEIGVPVDAPLIMSVARLVPWKGNADLISAMQYLPKNARLVLIGWGHLKDELLQQAQREGSREHIHFLGARNDVPELLKTADVYVQAHNYGANGDVWKGPNASQMEACAAGVPSVSTSVPLIESLIEDGVTGVLAKPNDPKDLARAIKYLLDNPQKAQELASAARKRVEERFSVRSMVASYESLYEALAGKK